MYLLLIVLNEIRSETSKEQWRYIGTGSNPADNG